VTVLLIAAIALGALQGYLFVAGLILLARGGKVTIGLLPGIVSVILFALFFLL
jgi:hypothetical protein